jgi:hypothetical protein
MSETTPEDVDAVEPAEPVSLATVPLGEQDRVGFYLDDDGKVRWRYRAAGNGAVMGGPQEGFSDLEAALANARRLTGRDLVFADRDVAPDGREIKAYVDDDDADFEPPELYTLPPAPPVD